MLIDEQFRKCVTYLFVEARNSDTGVLEKLPVGTAFFVDVLEGPAKLIYVVTARHVIDKSEAYDMLFMRLNTADSYLDVEVPTSQWTLHESTDVAVLRATVPAAAYDVLSIPHSNLLTDEGVKISGIGVGDEVFFAGLFSEHPGRERVQPIVRFGNIAMMPNEPVRALNLRVASRIDAYLVEARSWGGHSGSPCFVMFPPYRSGNSITVEKQLPVNTLGLVHGHHDIRMDVALTGEYGEGRVPLNAGIASVVPAQKILDLLMSDEFVQQRAAAQQAIARGLTS